MELYTFDGDAEFFSYHFVRVVLIAAQYEYIPALFRHFGECFADYMLDLCVEDRIRFAGFKGRYA